MVCRREQGEERDSMATVIVYLGLVELHGEPQLPSFEQSSCLTERVKRVARWCKREWRWCGLQLGWPWAFIAAERRTVDGVQGVGLGHANCGQCGGATDGSAVRASERENGGETSHVELLELAICNICGVLDGT